MNETIYKSNVSLPKNQSQRQLVFLADGKTAGYYCGTTFYKYVADKNLLYRPPAICLDNSVLLKLKRLGIKTITVKHKTDGTTWVLPLSTFIKRAFPIQRGFAGAQSCVCLKYWLNDLNQVQKANNEAVRSSQSDLKLGPRVIQPKLGGGLNGL